MRVLTVEGTPYEMGRQHGAHALGWRSFLLRRIQRRLALLFDDERVESWYREAVDTLLEIGQPFLDYARGQAESLGVDSDTLLRFCLASYLEDRLRAAEVVAEGCTAWAASGPWVARGETLLVKNRDQKFDLLGLQRLAYARPAHGYCYICLTTLGWPGLASSGINAAGLAVADTHVRSTDVGPGLPRWWAMMTILEQFVNVEEALDYLKSIPRLGNGNLVLADSTGAIAVFEDAHERCGIRRPEGHYIVATNHFVTPDLRERCLLKDIGKKGDTLARKERMEQALAEARGFVSPSWARVMMCAVDGIGALCWQNEKRDEGTISTAILSPSRRTIWARHGRLWHGAYRRFICPDSKEEAPRAVPVVAWGIE